MNSPTLGVCFGQVTLLCLSFSYTTGTRLSSLTESVRLCGGRTFCFHALQHGGPY